MATQGPFRRRDLGPAAAAQQARTPGGGARTAPRGLFDAGGGTPIRQPARSRPEPVDQDGRAGATFIPAEGAAPAAAAVAAGGTESEVLCEVQNWPHPAQDPGAPKKLTTRQVWDLHGLSFTSRPKRSEEQMEKDKENEQRPAVTKHLRNLENGASMLQMSNGAPRLPYGAVAELMDYYDLSRSTIQRMWLDLCDGLNAGLPR